TTDVRVEHPVHILRHERRVQRVQRPVRAPARPESIGEAHEVDLVDGAEELGHRALDNLVFQRWYAKRSLSTVGFGDVDAAHRLRPVVSAVHAVAQGLQLLRQTLFVCCDRFPVDSRCGSSLQPTKRSPERLDIHVVQQRRESGLLVSAGCLVDSRERWRQELPALRPVLRALTESVLRPAPSLHAPRLLRRLHQYYEQGRPPPSARLATSVFPRGEPPSATMPTDPVGPPGSRRRPFVRDAIHDPGGASPSCITHAYTWPSTTGTVSASTTFSLSGLSFRTPHDPCLRFGPRVTTTPARLGSARSATPLVGRDSHPPVIRQCSGALP